MAFHWYFIGIAVVSQWYIIALLTISLGFHQYACQENFGRLFLATTGPYRDHGGGDDDDYDFHDKHHTSKDSSCEELCDSPNSLLR